MNYIETLKQIQRLGRFPNFRVTSMYRSNSPSHKGQGAIDIRPVFGLLTNEDSNLRTLIRVLNLTWAGGLGYNWGEDCRHIHLDLGSFRRWKEVSKPGSGSCSSRMVLQAFPEHMKGSLTNEDFKNISNFSNDPMVYFPDLSSSRLSSYLANPKPIKDNPLVSFGEGIGGLGLAALLLVVMEGDKKNGFFSRFGR